MGGVEGAEKPLELAAGMLGTGETLGIWKDSGMISGDERDMLQKLSDRLSISDNGTGSTSGMFREIMDEAETNLPVRGSRRRMALGRRGGVTPEN